MTKKLVIIDDSSTQLNILKTLFTNNGWEVCGVQSAKIGYEVIFDFAPDLIITDAIMPLMGGFQLIKLIRENDKISKIPVIVYSILSESNAKFYIKEELSEYFLRKDNNQDELLALAQKIVEKYPIDNEYKDAILRVGLHNFEAQTQIFEEKIEEEKIEKTQEIEKTEEAEIKSFNFESFNQKIKNISDFSFDDKKILPKLFSCLYEELNYSLCVFSLYSLESKEKTSFFDIKNIILSPILRNTILSSHSSKVGDMYKRYAPNLETITCEEEFLSKLEFDFNYKDTNIAKITFYSCEELKWEEEEKINQIKEVLYKFSKARYIQKNSQNNTKDEISQYARPLNKFDNIKNEANMHFAIIQIANFSELNSKLSQEDLDIINSKISEKIIECLDKKEQVYKNDEDEYNIVIFTKDEKHARYRLEYILKELEEIFYDTYKIEIFIASANCYIEGNFNIIEAQKQARKLLDETHQDKVVIYNAK